MAASFEPAIMEKIKEVTAMPYAEQAKFYLNAFWNQGAEEEAETVWGLCEAFEKEDNVKGKAGNELNPIQAFHLLQQRNETMTALELKAQLRKVDIDANGEMALAEYLLFINNRDPVKFITNPQGDLDPKELEAAENRITELNTAFDNLTTQLAAQKEAEAAAKSAEAEAVRTEAKAKEEEAIAVDAEAKAKAEEAVALEAEAKATAAADKLKAAEDEVRKVEEEAQKIADDLKAQQDAHQAEIDRLAALSTDETVGIVKRNTAVQQLAQLKGTDPLPLQKAKLTQEAVVRRVAKAREAAEAETAVAKAAADEASGKRQVASDAAAKAQAAREAAVASRQQAEADRAAAEQKRAAAEEATKQVEQAVADIKVQMAEAEQALQELKAKTGSPLGAIWWNERIIIEKKKYLPTRFQ